MLVSIGMEKGPAITELVPRLDLVCFPRSLSPPFASNGAIGREPNGRAEDSLFGPFHLNSARVA